MLKATFIAWQRWGNGDNCLICYNCHAVPCLLWLIALEIHLVLELHTAKCQSRSGQRAVQMKLITELLPGPIDQNPALQFSIPCWCVLKECRTPCLDGSAWYSIWYIKPATLAYIAEGITRKCCQRVKSFLFCKEAQASVEEEEVLIWWKGLCQQFNILKLRASVQLSPPSNTTTHF